MNQRFQPETTMDTSPAPTAPPEIPPSTGERPPPSEPVEFKKITLAELGANLPCGVVSAGQRVKPFRLRPWRLKDEKHLGQLRDKRGQRVGAFATEVLAYMVQTVGPHAFDAMAPVERKMVLSGMYMADILYMYLYLRYEALGSDEPVPMMLVCPHCRQQSRFDADLGSMEVETVSEGALDLRWIDQLRDGIEIEGQMRQNLWLQPLVWSSVEGLDMGAGARAVPYIQASICGAEGCSRNPFAITESELDEMTKFDMEGLATSIGSRAPGPVMIIKTDCPKCRLELTQMLDWGYDSFFSRTSQQKVGTP